MNTAGVEALERPVLPPGHIGQQGVVINTASLHTCVPYVSATCTEISAVIKRFGAHRDHHRVKRRQKDLAAAYHHLERASPDSAARRFYRPPSVSTFDVPVR